MALASRKRRAIQELRRMVHDYAETDSDEEPPSPRSYSSEELPRLVSREPSDSSSSSTSSAGSEDGTERDDDEDMEQDEVEEEGGGSDTEELSEHGSVDEDDDEEEEESSRVGDEEDDDEEEEEVEDEAEPEEVDDAEDEEMEEEEDIDEEEEVDTETEKPSFDDCLSSGDSSSDDDTDMLEKSYSDRREELLKQLKMLDDGTLPEYAKGAKELDKWYQHEIDRAEEEYKRTLHHYKAEYDTELKQISDDLEEKKAESLQQLIEDLEDRKRMLEQDMGSLEIFADGPEPRFFKPIATRKLRRRPNDPAPIKKGGPRAPAQVKIVLDEDTINADLLEILPDSSIFNTPVASGRRATSAVKESPKEVPPESPKPTTSTAQECLSPDSRIEDGKLYYDKRWYMRGQAITVISRDGARTSGVISAINTESIWVRRGPGQRMQVTLSQLQSGKVTLRRRAS